MEGKGSGMGREMGAEWAGGGREGDGEGESKRVREGERKKWSKEGRRRRRKRDKETERAQLVVPQRITSAQTITSRADTSRTPCDCQSQQPVCFAAHESDANCFIMMNDMRQTPIIIIIIIIIIKFLQRHTIVTLEPLLSSASICHFFIARQHAYTHAERDIVLPVLSVCPFVCLSNVQYCVYTNGHIVTPF